ncbi:periplasmic protein torT precursor [Vibrio variabilis]|uniref:Periplasmic protein torT n=1 Tax=Vibrio variabilis TaxID=990271 RepID=A0ABQ0JBS0_9VIBR|nr:periplasmic protein torT precursor [Vibrio variabilis]
MLIGTGWVIKSASLAKKHPKGSGTVDIAFLPGPQSSGGTKPVILGFLQAIKGSDVNVMETLWADNDKELQRNLIQEVIENHPALITLLAAQWQLKPPSANLETTKLAKISNYCLYTSVMACTEDFCAVKLNSLPLIKW